MMLTHQLTIDEVNNLLSERFIRIFGNVVEHFPAASIAILKNRPFVDINDLIKSISDFLDSLKPHEQVRILQQYPDIINRLIYSSELPLERDEIEIDHLGIEEKTRLKELDNQYKEKFGFPFITDDKEKDVNKIFSEIVSRLKNDKQQETEETMKIVKDIVKLRIHEIVR